MSTMTFENGAEVFGQPICELSSRSAKGGDSA
jgi:hypothetical protein